MMDLFAFLNRDQILPLARRASSQINLSLPPNHVFCSLLNSLSGTMFLPLQIPIPQQSEKLPQLQHFLDSFLFISCDDLA